VTDRYPGYDVLAKRNSPSWNDQTRRVVDERLRIDPEQHRFFTQSEWDTVRALCDRIVPQPAERVNPVPLAAMLDEKLHTNSTDGYRDHRLPPVREAWRRALQAFDAEAHKLKHCAFHQLEPALQIKLLTDALRSKTDIIFTISQHRQLYYQCKCSNNAKADISARAFKYLI